MIGVSRLAVVVASALLGAGTLVSAQFKSGAQAVRVDVLVTDRDKTVTGLTAANFEVRDEGVVQSIAAVERESLALNVICAFDTSGSVAGELLRNLSSAGVALLAGLKDRDRVALVSFSDRVRLLSSLTPDRQVIRTAFSTLEARGRTTLRDGLFAGLALREADPGRTLLLLFSDGKDTGSWLTTRRVLDAARRSDVVVYPVAAKGVSEISVIRDPLSSPTGSANMITTMKFGGDYGPFLDDVAEETGGRVVVAQSGKDLTAAFIGILAEFRDRYVLTYTPTGVPPPGWHRLEVKLKGARGRVTARRGYVSQ